MDGPQVCWRPLWPPEWVRCWNRRKEALARWLTNEYHDHHHWQSHNWLPTFGNSGPILATVDFPALTRVVLKGMPRLPVIHALEDGHWVGFSGAELETDISQLIFLAQTQGQSDVLVDLSERLGHPASQVVRVVQVGQVGVRVAQLRVVLIAELAVADDVSPLVVWGHTESSGRTTAFTRHLSTDPMFQWVRSQLNSIVCQTFLDSSSEHFL